MTRLPRIKGQELVAALRRAGFEMLRVKGSHYFLRHPDGRCTVVPELTRSWIGLHSCTESMWSMHCELCVLDGSQISRRPCLKEDVRA
jgi:predicted RNA binding protein YcfA (HicA-like mRNA interferase family)